MIYIGSPRTVISSDLADPFEAQPPAKPAISSTHFVNLPFPWMR